MKSEQFMSDEIIARSKSGWDGARPFQVLVYQCGSPAGASEGRCGHSHLIDLEPSGSRSVTGRKCGCAFVHPYHDWTLLMRPLLPDCGDGGSRCNRGAESCACSTVTSHLDVADS